MKARTPIEFTLLAGLLLWIGTAWAEDDGAPTKMGSAKHLKMAEPAVESAEQTDGENTKKSNPKDGFHFGTYGRIQVSSDVTDLGGRPGRDANIAAHGPRLMEGPYLELDFGYSAHTEDGFGVKVLSTLAFTGEFFHFNGDFTDTVAIRNLYAEAEHFLPTDLKIWIGSRMYRGDDIYLLDFWPLDNLNTYGGGLDWSGYNLRLQWQIGVNRLKNENQLKEIEVPATFGSETITIMERMKLITSLKATYFLHDLTPSLSMKLSLYGEFHHLPAGEFNYSKDQVKYLEKYGLNVGPGYKLELPEDYGYAVGLQVGFWKFAPNSHVNLFLRYAGDMAAYGEWSEPWGVAPDRTSKGAKELVIAASVNYESHWVGLLVGGYSRYFKDADRNKYDLDDYWEGVLSVRPAIFISRHFHWLFELSHQWKVPTALSEKDAKRQRPQVWQLSIMPALSMDRGMYRRPQFRLVYTVSHLNSDARDLFPQWDIRRDRAWQHFIGAQVEWWLDSSSYQ